ncbi:hypothetical protein FJY71_09905, partial [candidate division WOR-3 bacterium]|nr:hypothetical protein [candidate division WOR-3 bacterium]
SCHGQPGGSVYVLGFPSSYVPGQPYVVKLKRSSGATIRNFNASVRAGTGSQTAGTITAGLNTLTYSRAEEPNGVHLSSSNRDSCTFTWTAPAAGTGEVRLYVGAYQGSSQNSGINTRLSLTAAESRPAVEEAGAAPVAVLAFGLWPTVAAGQLFIRVSGNGAGPAAVRITDAAGRLVAGFDVLEEHTTIAWTPATPDGSRLPAGSYFAVLNSGGSRLVRRFALGTD